MAIAKDNTRNTYYITYQLKTDSGYKTCKIRNAEWKMKGEGKVSLSYMHSIEHRLIEEDKRKRSTYLPTGSEMTLKDLENRFYSYLKSEYIDEDTIYSYALTYKNHLHPYISEDTRVSKALTVSNLDIFKEKLALKGFKERTVNNKLVAVKKLVEYAKRKKFMNREVADDIIDSLHPIKENNNDEASTNFFQDPREDARKFFETFMYEDAEWLLPMQVLFYGAFRIGEFLAIKAEDVNPINGTIRVNKQITCHGDEKLKTKGRKSRVVHIPKDCMYDIVRHIRENRLSQDDLLFTSSTGNHLVRNVVRSKVNKHLEMAGLRHITLHGLRHSFASYMFENGFSQTLVQAQLGHSHLSTTNDYYIHLTKSQEDKSFNDLELN